MIFLTQTFLNLNRQNTKKIQCRFSLLNFFIHYSFLLKRCFFRQIYVLNINLHAIKLYKKVHENWSCFVFQFFNQEYSEHLSTFTDLSSGVFIDVLCLLTCNSHEPLMPLPGTANQNLSGWQVTCVLQAKKRS